MNLQNLHRRHCFAASHHLLDVVCCLLFAVCCLLFAVCCLLLFAVCFRRRGPSDRILPEEGFLIPGLCPLDHSLYFEVAQMRRILQPETNRSLNPGLIPELMSYLVQMNPATLNLAAAA